MAERRLGSKDAVFIEGSANRTVIGGIHDAHRSVARGPEWRLGDALHDSERHAAR